jgi:hypothetical protein
MNIAYLEFTDEDEARSILCDFYSAEFGWDLSIIDPVGILYNNDAVFDTQGNCITEPTPLVGWHMNLIGNLPASALAYELNPAKPKRVFAE